MPRKGQETALEWLKRVKRDSKNPDARRLAAFAFDEWKRLEASWKRLGVKTRRSLWDLIAGVFECHQKIEHYALMTPVISGDDSFYFPVFKEACGRRAKHSTASDAIASGILMRSERLPQTGKWGNTICKT